MSRHVPSVRDRIVSGEPQHDRIYPFRPWRRGASRDGAPLCLAPVLARATIAPDHDKPHEWNRIMPDLPSGTVAFLFTDIAGSMLTMDVWCLF